MKKMMFSALACVAFAFSGFASNEVVDEPKNEIDNFSLNGSTINDSNFGLEEDWGLCTITITVTNADGEVTDTATYHRLAESAADCTSKGNAIAKELAPHISNGRIPDLMK